MNLICPMYPREEESTVQYSTVPVLVWCREEESRPGERDCSRWELSPLARAITAYCNSDASDDSDDMMIFS